MKKGDKVTFELDTAMPYRKIQGVIIKSYKGYVDIFVTKPKILAGDNIIEVRKSKVVVI